MLAAAAALLLAGAWTPARADTIHRKNGTEINDVQVIGETIQQTTYVLPGAVRVVQKMDSQKIARVEYDSAPMDYEQGLEALKANYFQDAVNKFQQAMRANTEDYPWARQYSLFQIGEAYRAWADAGATQHYKTALGAYQALLKDIPDSIHKYRAMLGMGDCLLALGDKRQATSYFEKVIGDNYDPSYTIRAKIGLARILEMDEKYREARSKFREIYNEARTLARSDPSAKEIPNLALVREGACIVGLRKYDEAIAFFQDIISKTDNDEILAGAYNGLGDSYYAKRQIEKAMWAFLKVAIVFEHVTSEAPKAFFYASVTLQDMATKLKDEKQARDWVRRAKRLKSELRQKFPGSEWAKRR